jgi:hypothetical protein
MIVSKASLIRTTRRAVRAVNIIITTMTPIIALQCKSMCATPADLRDVTVTVLLRVVAITVLRPSLQHPESPWAQPPPTCASLNLCTRRYSTRRYPQGPTAPVVLMTAGPAQRNAGTALYGERRYNTVRYLGAFVRSFKAPWPTQIATESSFNVENDGAYLRCEI